MQIRHHNGNNFFDIDTSVFFYRNRRFRFEKNPIRASFVKRILPLFIIVKKMTTKATEKGRE